MSAESSELPHPGTSILSSFPQSLVMKLRNCFQSPYHSNALSPLAAKKPSQNLTLLNSAWSSGTSPLSGPSTIVSQFVQLMRHCLGPHLSKKFDQLIEQMVISMYSCLWKDCKSLLLNQSQPSLWLQEPDTAVIMDRSMPTGIIRRGLKFFQTWCKANFLTGSDQGTKSRRASHLICSQDDVTGLCKAITRWRCYKWSLNEQ